MDRLASLQMALMALACCGLLARRTEASDRCEWGLVLVLLNAAALSSWVASHSAAELPGLWLRHAAAAIGLALAWRLALELRGVRPPTLRRFLAPVSYLALTLGALMAAPPALAAEAEVLPTIPVASKTPPEPAAVTLDAVEVRGQQGYAAESAVGGTKTETPVLETPLAISVIGRGQLEDQGVQTLQEALRYSAGVRSDAFGLDSRGDWALIRGTDAMYFLDGLRMLFAAYNTVRPDPWTLENIEILRGPASVLYGQAPSGGVINLNSKLPQRHSAHQLRAEYGSFRRQQYALDSTGPLTADGELSYRLLGLTRDSETQVDYVRDDRWLVSPSLRWTPTDRFSWTLLARVQRDDTGSTTAFLPWEGTILPSRNGRIPDNRFVSEPDFDRYDMRQTAVTSLLELQLGDQWTLRQNLRWSDSEGRYHSLFPNIYTGDPYLLDPLRRRSVLRVSHISDTDTRTLTADQMLQGRLRTGPVEHLLLLGYDYSRTGIDEVYGSLGDTPLQVILQGGFDLYDPQYGRYIVPQTARLPRAELRQSGFYLQNQMYLGQHWIALLGARHDSASSGNSGSAAQEDSETSLRAALLYRFDAGFSPYIGYAESFEPVAGHGEDGAAFKPVRARQTEAGIKYQPPGSASLFTLSAFETKQKNRLAPGPDPQFQVQLGEAELRGIEFEAYTTLFKRLDINASYTWLDAASDEGPDAAEGTRDKALAGVAEHSGSLWACLRFDIAGLPGFKAGSGLRYTGETTDQSRTVTVPATTLFDAMLAWESRHWRVAVDGRNLEDESYIATCLERGDCFYGSRRSVVGSLAYKF